MYELILSDAGNVSLALDDEIMWVSDGDEEFCEEFGDVIESGELNDVAAWLVDEGYIPPGVDIDIVDETIEAGEDSGWFKTLETDEDEE